MFHSTFLPCECRFYSTMWDSTRMFTTTWAAWRRGPPFHWGQSLGLSLLCMAIKSLTPNIHSTILIWANINWGRMAGKGVMGTAIVQTTFAFLGRQAIWCRFFWLYLHIVHPKMWIDSSWPMAGMKYIRLQNWWCSEVIFWLMTPFISLTLLAGSMFFIQMHW